MLKFIMKSRLIFRQILFFFFLLFLIIPFVYANYIGPITPRGIFGIIIMFIIIYLFNLFIEFIINYNYLHSYYSKSSKLFFSVAYINFITYPLAQALGLLISTFSSLYFYVLYYILAELIIIYCEWRYLFYKIKVINTYIEKSIVLRSVLIANILSFIILLIINGFLPPIYFWFN